MLWCTDWRIKKKISPSYLTLLLSWNASNACRRPASLAGQNPIIRAKEPCGESYARVMFLLECMMLLTLIVVLCFLEGK